jgi:hypothetical protein
VPFFGQLLPQVYGRTVFTDTATRAPAVANVPANAVVVINVGTNDLLAQNPPSVQSAGKALAMFLKTRVLKPQTPLVIMWCGLMRAPTCSAARHAQALLVGTVQVRILDCSRWTGQTGGAANAFHPTFNVHSAIAAMLQKELLSDVGVATDPLVRV